MAALLERLPENERSTEFAARIRAGFGSAAQSHEARAPAPGSRSGGAGSLVEPLTNREQDVLALLADRLRDKEIAEKLVVSPATVKSHLKGLYRKLDVGDRREAVSRAREMGILARP
jgi:LuxR family maltose regulon positive regulatory protein